MRDIGRTCVFLWIAVGIAFQARSADDAAPQVWISSEDMQFRLSRLPESAVAWPISRHGERNPIIRVNVHDTHQSILGLGSSLEHTTCYNLSRLPEALRRETIRKLVSPGAGIGMNLMRVCIGTPDFTGEPWYSYDDPPGGAPDPQLNYFSIDRDRAYILPAIKMALEENPSLLLYASPWSPPGWMKTTGTMIGGQLKREYYGVYAQYFVRFVQAYAQEGIPIHAVTVQNEPGVDRSKESDPKWHYPSCRWSGEDERDFIRDHLGPAFVRAGLQTQIWTYDHNFNVKPTPDGDDPGIEYPATVLGDTAAARFVDGVAFHGYAGSADGMSEFAKRFPRVPLYFTEGSTFGTRGALKIVDYFSNGASSYNAWVTMIDEQGGPNNGPFEASKTCITLDSIRLETQYHFDFYMYGQFMKFIQRGAVRLGTTSEAGAREAVAFRNPDGTLVVIAVNPDRNTQTLCIDTDLGDAVFAMPPLSVASVVFVARH